MWEHGNVTFGYAIFLVVVGGHVSFWAIAPLIVLSQLNLRRYKIIVVVGTAAAPRKINQQQNPDNWSSELD